MTLAAAILIEPKERDRELIQLMDPSLIVRGFAQETVMGAIELLKNRSILRNEDLENLTVWASKMPDPTDATREKIGRIKNAS